MKIVITESQFENVRRQTTGLVILDESHDKYKDMLSDEELDEIILQYKGKPVQKFRDEQPKIYGRFQARGPCVDENGTVVGCYSKARVKNTRGALNDLTKDMVKTKNIYSDKELEDAAKQYKHISDFQNKDPNKEKQARNKGEEFFKKITSHMTPKGGYGRKMVYVYEFTEKDEKGNSKPVAAYVGITSNEERRNIEHTTGVDYFGKESDSSSVYRFLKSNPGTTYEFKKLSDGYIPFEEAQKLESEFENKYRNDGWLILNVAKTGSLGSTFKISDEEVKKQLDKYTHYSDFYNNTSLLNRVKRGGLFHLTDKLIRDRQIHTPEKIIDIAKKYDSYSDFKKELRHTVWQAAYRAGMLDQIKQMFKEKEENINL
jgi:hypothetical protein